MRYKAIAAGWVLGKLDEAGNGLNLLVLDACRDNPYTRRWRSSQTGLAEMRAGQGMLIAYAALPGQVAQDGTGRNSPYTRYLLQQLPQPGLSLEEVFRRVRAAVVAETSGKQTPQEWSTLMGEFRFVTEAADRRVVFTPPTEIHRVSPTTGQFPQSFGTCWPGPRSGDVGAGRDLC